MTPESPQPPSTEELLAEMLVEVRQANQRIGRIQFVILTAAALFAGLSALVILLAVLREVPGLVCLGAFPILALLLLFYWVMKARPQEPQV